MKIQGRLRKNKCQQSLRKILQKVATCKIECSLRPFTLSRQTFVKKNVRAFVKEKTLTLGNTMMLKELAGNYLREFPDALDLRSQTIRDSRMQRYWGFCPTIMKLGHE